MEVYFLTTGTVSVDSVLIDDVSTLMYEFSALILGISFLIIGLSLVVLTSGFFTATFLLAIMTRDRWFEVKNTMVPVKDNQ